MREKAILWDLDGTLLDTLDDLADAVNHALRASGCPSRTREEVRAFVGNGMRKLIERAVPAGCDDGTREAVLREFSVYYKAHANDKTKPYPGIPALLGELAGRGIRMAILSNKPDFAVKDLVSLHFGSEIERAVGARDGVRTKPAPDALLAVLGEMGLTPADAIYIGDSEVDVETARNAGMRLVAVSWGFRSGETLQNAGATEICASVDALAEALR